MQHTPEAREAMQEWPSGAWSRPARNAFCALLALCGKPALARSLMDDLELWSDDRRPPAEAVRDWAKRWREGGITVPPAFAEGIKAQYDGLRRADLDESIRKANIAHRELTKSVERGEFNKDTSGALQHLGQFIAIGTEKRMQAFEPRKETEEKPQTPTFILMPPPERRELPQGEIVEVTEVAGA